MEEIKQEFISWNKFTPDYDVPLILQTNYGLRRAVYYSHYGDRLFLIPALWATDCTHPMQNMNMMGCVIGWKYEDDHYAETGGYHVNHWARQEEGEQILKSIKKKSLFRRLISQAEEYLKSL